MHKQFLVAAFASSIALGGAEASDSVRGTETTFTSPNGITERCVRIAPMPGAVYSGGDLNDEEDYCEIDLYAPTVALCPKVWSTSPGMMVYDISQGTYAGRRDDFQRNACIEGKAAGNLAHDDLAKFKPTMNQSGTSGTFSPSPLLYYHFSRYFQMEAKVPVAVWRSMDREVHLTEVAEPGRAISGHSHSSGMNHRGWEVLVSADQNPDRYSPTDELFTSDRSQLYGVLLNSPGHRTGSEINGTRASGWGKGQNRDFQETPPFLALRSSAPLIEAIAEGLEEGRRNRQIARDLGDNTTPQQMAYWMREISEIVLMDYIFSQQDRVGNIDFRPYYYWVENGEIERSRTNHHEPADGTVPTDAILLRRTMLNDNDAGGRVAYANFTKSTQMLEKLRHFDAGVYQRLLALDADLQAQGEVFQYVSISFGLTDRQVQQIVSNTRLATAILQDTCTAGEMLFDLSPEEFFLTGGVVPQSVDCSTS